MAEVKHPDFPGERLVVCLNPRLREERRRKREDLLKATEEALHRIAAEARLDGIYVIRASLDAEAMGTEAAVDAYKSLAGGGRAFRNAKTDLRIRPVYACTADHVKAHVFLCMLALHVEWHMRRRLAPMFSGDDDRGSTRLQTI